ncbi:MAG: plastocyanin/azurin family copper-binding protein [Microbacteriaceae bacterium]
MTLRNRRRLRVAALVAALTLLLVACGGDDDAPGLSGTPSATEGGSADAANEVTIEMTDALKFSPQRVTIKVGGTVTWENPSTVVHTATGDPDKVADADNVSLPDGAEAWDSGFVRPGDSFSHTFTEPGTYEYACIPHEGVGMVGTVVVER